MGAPARVGRGGQMLVMSSIIGLPTILYRYISSNNSLWREALLPLDNLPPDFELPTSALRRPIGMPAGVLYNRHGHLSSHTDKFALWVLYLAREERILPGNILVPRHTALGGPKYLSNVSIQWEPPTWAAMGELEWIDEEDGESDQGGGRARAGWTRTARNSGDTTVAPLSRIPDQLPSSPFLKSPSLLGSRPVPTAAEDPASPQQEPSRFANLKRESDWTVDLEVQSALKACQGVEDVKRLLEELVSVIPPAYTSVLPADVTNYG
ncbi:hypothetical protein Rhopal_007582-T1 [Rhodotorula paludigena]|uniref:Uncharacterized protein n=1 Tax=Rhodotorula paludigena TaxID=86838 RepID=A0AAV5GYG3_9BASI|nr:hypothetical protein Rhopal_007582-T1 [Rhodotorula paludigena]